MLLLSKQRAKAKVKKNLLSVTAALATAVGTLTAIRIASLLRILPTPATAIWIARLLLILVALLRRALQEPNEVFWPQPLRPCHQTPSASRLQVCF